MKKYLLSGLTLVILLVLTNLFTHQLEDKDLSMVMSLILGAFSGWVTVQVYSLLD